MNVVKSIGAIIAGLVVATALSTGTDAILEAAGILPHGHIYVALPMLIAVIVYRTAFNALAAYVVARLAPSRPMAHAVGLGAFGSVGSLVAAVTTWNMNIGPHWYPIALAVIGVPTAWAGAKLAERRAGTRRTVLAAA